MSFSIPNTALPDPPAFADFTTSQPCITGSLTVANAAANIVLVSGNYGQTREEPAIYVPPTSIPIIRPANAYLYGFRAQNALAGATARVFGGFWGASDPSLGGGSPFNTEVGAGGGIVTPGLAQLGAVATAGLTLGVAIAPIPGCTVTFTVNGTAATISIIGTFDINVSVFAATTALGWVFIDAGGVATATFAPTAVNERYQVAATYTAAIGAGNHTVTLQGQKIAAVGTYIVQNAQLSVIVNDR